ncbi:MAG: Hsp70 family protein [Calothrix sp. FI2-JRJ7]|jgi:molecular chaperone DnaK|nr:Hsp70 family protein [Calothrix sp. FI2-JRJ7]
MGKAIGIDLGTTNSVAAFKLAEVEVITADNNTPPDRKLTRSVVACEQNNLCVGEKAYNQQRADAENVIVSIKRLIGRDFADKTVQEQKSKFGYKISQPSQGTDNGIAVWLGGKEYQPEDISAEILKQVVKNTQLYYEKMGKVGEVINQAVITIPAYFNDKQRHATRTAALKAGITPLELLPEPTAAAISYGFSPTSEDVKTILVYDFGGGTFDASLITSAGTSFIEQGKAGDLWLGGDDIDSRIINYVKEQVANNEKIGDIDALIAKMPHYQKVRFNADLKMAVERAKFELSNASVALINPSTPIVDELGLAVPVEVEIARKLFEELIADLVERSITICRQALVEAESSLDMVDVVLLVGGSSQIPFVQNKVKAAFGNDKVVVHPRPMYAVAEGAAIVAAGLTDKVTTVSRDYYIELVDDNHKVINRGDILPVTTSHTFRTVVDGQRLIHFRFFSPDFVKHKTDGVEKDEIIGEMWLGLEQKYPAGTEIQVYLELDEKNSDLGITAHLKNDPSVKVSCTFSRGRSDEKIYRELEEAIARLNDQNLTALGVENALILAIPVVQLANQIIEPITGEERVDLRERAVKNLEKFQVSMSNERLEADSLIQDSEQIVDLCGFLIPQQQQERLEKHCTELRDAITSNNLYKMESKTQELRREFENLPNEVKLVDACLFAIRQAKRVDPTQANAMIEKLMRMLAAMESVDQHEAERLWNSLQPDIQRWIDSKLPSTTIVTGLKR